MVVTYHVYLVDSIGVATSVTEFATREEAESEAEYLMERRDWSQTLDGTVFEVRP